jgi:hypothetical protein
VYVMRVVPIVIRYVLPFIPKFWRRVDDFEARVAVLWMIGEHGEEVPEAPYLLESAVHGYSQVRCIIFLIFIIIHNSNLSLYLFYSFYFMRQYIILFHLILHERTYLPTPTLLSGTTRS